MNSDEQLVALKCGPFDYHSIAYRNGQWFNKSGQKMGLYIDESLVTNDIWYPIWEENGIVYTTHSVYYGDETIYLTIKEGWDTQ